MIDNEQLNGGLLGLQLEPELLLQSPLPDRKRVAPAICIDIQSDVVTPSIPVLSTTGTGAPLAREGTEGSWLLNIGIVS